MFSVITNIYNKKTKDLPQENWKKVFILQTRDVRCVHHGWHGTHRYDIQVSVCGKNLTTVPMRAVSPVVHTSNSSSC